MFSESRKVKQGEHPLFSVISSPQFGALSFQTKHASEPIVFICYTFQPIIKICADRYEMDHRKCNFHVIFTLLYLLPYLVFLVISVICSIEMYFR